MPEADWDKFERMTKAKRTATLSIYAITASNRMKSSNAFFTITSIVWMSDVLMMFTFLMVAQIAGGV